MIAITIGTFCFVFTFMIVMSSLSTFCTFFFVLAESFVVVVFLTIKTTLCIWSVNFCITNQETNFDLKGYVWTINGQYVWILRYQQPILASLHAFNFCNTWWSQCILMSSTSIFLNSLHPITPLQELSALWGVILTGTSINSSALRLSLFAIINRLYRFIWTSHSFLWLLCAMRKYPFGLLNVWDCHRLLLRLKIGANCLWGCRWAWGWLFYVLSCSYWFSVAFWKVCHQDLFHEAYNHKPISLKIKKHDPHKEPFKHPRLSHPKRDNLPLRHSPPNHALVAHFNSSQGRTSPQPLGGGCPVVSGRLAQTKVRD